MHLAALHAGVQVVHHRLQRHLGRGAAAEAQQDGPLLRRQLAAVRTVEWIARISTGQRVWRVRRQ